MNLSALCHIAVSMIVMADRLVRRDLRGFGASFSDRLSENEGSVNGDE